VNKLEFPGNDERLNPTRLYLARGAKEISPFRPYLIGDVFDHVPIPNGKGGEKYRRVAILQHPCSMRKDGVNLKDSILAAKVSRRKALTIDEWTGGYFNLMPLPELEENDNPKHRDHAIEFDNLYTVSPEQLEKPTESLPYRQSASTYCSNDGCITRQGSWFPHLHSTRRRHHSAKRPI
jgi:hypothetical protein